MRTETITKTIYQFNELPEDAKQKAIEKLSDINTDYEWWDCAYEDAANVGLKITGFDLDRASYCKIEYIEDACHAAHKIIENHGESCDTYKNASEFLKNRDEIVNNAAKDENGDFENEYELDQKLDEIENEFLKTLSEDYWIILQQEYEYRTSEEAIIETIEANEYEFDENGNLA